MSKRGDNIHHRKDGRWEVRIKMEILQNGKAKYKSLYGHSYSEAKQKMMEFYKNSCSRTEKNHMKFKDLTYVWLNEINAHIKPSTALKYGYLVEKHILPELGDTELGKLNGTLLTNFAERKFVSGRISGNGELSCSYVKTILTVIKSILTYGEKIGKCKNISFVSPDFRGSKKKINILSQMEQFVLQSYLENNTDETKIGIMIALNTGLRIGEICALKWDDIDIENGVIYIRHTVSRIADRQSDGFSTSLIIGPPKTTDSLREIPIPEFMKKHLIKQKMMAMSEYVVSDKKTFLSPRTFEYRFHKITCESNIRKINFHALRHTFATRCIEKGMDIKTLSELLGHSDVTITLNTYVHSSMDTKRIQLEKTIKSFYSDCGQNFGQAFEDTA